MRGAPRDVWTSRNRRAACNDGHERGEIGYFGRAREESFTIASLMRTTMTVFESKAFELSHAERFSLLPRYPGLISRIEIQSAGGETCLGPMQSRADCRLEMIERSTKI